MQSIRDVLNFGGQNVKMAIVGTALFAFNFLLTLMLYTCSKSDEGTANVATSDARWRHCRIRFACRRDDVWRASRDVLQTCPALRGTSVEEPAVPQAA